MNSLKKISTFAGSLFQMINVSSRTIFHKSPVAIGWNRPYFDKEFPCHNNSAPVGKAAFNHNHERLLCRDSLQLEASCNNIYKYPNESGYSFLELVIVIALIGIIAGVMSQMFMFGVNMFDSSVSRKDTVPASRIAVEFLVDDLRAIADVADIASAATTGLQFDTIDSETIGYSYSSGTLSRNSNVLLDGLSDFQFVYSDVDGNTLSSPVSTPSDIWKISFSIDATVDGNPFHLESAVVPRKF